MTDAMLGAGLGRFRAGPFETHKDQSSNEKVPSQGLRGTFKNCQRLILAESVTAKNAVFMGPLNSSFISTGHTTGHKI
ncbi:hypothetical protein EJO68_09985 [Variovorax atrisoli]|uniref:hypothetical protein n=1 Tax=Variovorax atrisoli TaxID=3394203 RepID=UPI000F7F2D00|nr:hypothetical protein [Variovorax sp. 369]RTD94129.1 hypothetical protein EJO68_09985 [Variovorax sp. 369]